MKIGSLDLEHKANITECKFGIYWMWAKLINREGEATTQV
jgi:hypothetical protein